MKKIFLMMVFFVPLLCAGQPCPSYLKDYKELYKENPRKAALAWFQNARYGLFIHYGLYSVEAKHPFLQFEEKIPVAEYEKLAGKFDARNFDARKIAKLAKKTGLKYITFVTKHCDGFCLWDSPSNEFNSMNSAARRDLVAEMAEACEKEGLGLFLFYEHGFDWHHPHAPRKKDWNCSLTEVPYESPEPTYAYEDYDLNNYVEYVKAQIKELLTQYGSIAGIWLDGAAVPTNGETSRFKLQELYDMIHRLQPQALVAYKYGVIGTEDFLAPEYIQLQNVDANEWTRKPAEICVPLNKSWGYVEGEPHMNIEQLLVWKQRADESFANLLINVGPRGDGSIDERDEKTLKQFSKYLK